MPQDNGNGDRPTVWKNSKRIDGLHSDLKDLGYALSKELSEKFRDEQETLDLKFAAAIAGQVKDRNDRLGKLQRSVDALRPARQTGSGTVQAPGIVLSQVQTRAAVLGLAVLVVLLLLGADVPTTASYLFKLVFP